MQPIENLKRDHQSILQALQIIAKIAAYIKMDQTYNLEHVEKLIDFVKNFADGYHHNKEENILFPELVKLGISRDSGPVGVMLYEHEMGRVYIKGAIESIAIIKTGNDSANILLGTNLDGYASLLQNHIIKEENILFPMADRVLTNDKKEYINRQFIKLEEELNWAEEYKYYIEFITEYSEMYL